MCCVYVCVKMIVFMHMRISSLVVCDYDVHDCATYVCVCLLE